jgi:hypothetical protein
MRLGVEVVGALGPVRILSLGSRVAAGRRLSRARRALFCWGAQREGGVYLGFGEDDAAAGAVRLFVRL